MFLGRDVDKFEVKEEDHGDPAIDGGVGLDVGVIEHSANENCIHFDYKVVDANEV